VALRISVATEDLEKVPVSQNVGTVKKENLLILRNSALFAAAGAIGCSIGSGAPAIICFILFFPMFIVAYLLGFPWIKKK